MNRFLLILPLAACAAPLAEYEPVVDRPTGRYAQDLAECRSLAAEAEAQYNERVGAQMVANIILGAALGAAIGDSSQAAAYGALAGGAATDTEIAHGGPRRIIDRCLAGRGHRVLSDLGRG
ncbi:MAG: hypothetical protein M0R28_20305 [Pigmentiphaga sp.]|nr:hypothetical protein [Pigmentiphaga sp.]